MTFAGMNPLPFGGLSVLADAIILAFLLLGLDVFVISWQERHR